MKTYSIPSRLGSALEVFGRSGRLSLLFYGALLLPGTALAYEDVVSQKPLFMEAGVQPNIFFVLDDSGSMSWEALKSEGAREAHSTSAYTDETLINFEPSSEPDQDIPAKLGLCAGYNVLTYNPELDYSPWKGLDEQGVAFTDQTAEKAMANPYTKYNPSLVCEVKEVTSTPRTRDGVDNENGLRCDLTSDFNGGDGAFYYVWDDADGDGDYDIGECPTDGTSRANPGSRVYVKDLPAGQRANYANWFSYYRKREYVLKRALSEVIEESQARIGFATINKNTHITKDSAVGTVIKDIDNISLPRDLAADENKAKLLDNLLGLGPGDRTPLRKALSRTGEYFKGEMTGTTLFGFTPPDDVDSAYKHSPILKQELGGQCQQNFAVVVSDGFWNGSTPDDIGNADADTSNPYDGTSYADTFSDTLADVAMKFYKGDLIGTLDNEVPTITGVIPKNTNDNPTDRDLPYVDDNPAQHLVTYTVAFGVSGDTACYPPNRDQSVEEQGWPEICGNPAHTGTGTGWPEPVRNLPTTVDDMRHAAWNGRGRFLSAKKPGGLIRQLNSALNNIGSRVTTSAAPVAANSTSVKDGNQVVFQASFNSSDWSGDLAAYDLSAAGAGERLWSAKEGLQGRDPNARILITYNGSQGIPFRFPVDYLNPTDTELNRTQIKDLLNDAPYKEDGGYPWDDEAPSTDWDSNHEKVIANQVWGNNLLQYLRGDRANESEMTDDGRPFRPRGGLLGDVIHASPVLVATPDPSLYDDASYQTWAASTAMQERTPVIYLGANDGALHAFNAETGAELFAYYPGMIFADGTKSGLHLLADFDYQHRYYVDQTPTVAEVYIGTPTGDAKAWRTVLVGGLRAGGKGIYALDVTDPAEFTDETAAAAKVLWEFTHPDLGYSFSKPTLALLNDGRWGAIFGNGYNAANDGTAKLFIHYLDDWDHSEVQILTTNRGSNLSGECGERLLEECNGMDTPAVVDLNGDGTADRVYVGDRLGNLWAFDLSRSDSADWRSAYPASGSGQPQPLFTAVGKDHEDLDKPQPITSQPAVTLHLTKKSIETEPNLLVFFGTGQFLTVADSMLEENDAGEPLVTTQSFYGIWDAGGPISGRSDLVEQTLERSTHTIDGIDYQVRTLSNENVDYETKKGWHLDFNDDLEPGERVISSPLLFGELLVYNTITPRSTQCDGGGSSWLMIHDFFDGSEPNFIALDVNNNGVWDAEDVTDTGENVAGVHTGNLFWQPTIVQTGSGAQGTVLLPTDSDGSDGSLQTQNLQGGQNKVVRSSWTRYDF